MSAAALAWLETESGRQEEQAFVDASRIATEAFVSITASQPKLHFVQDAVRDSTLLDALATTRPVDFGSGPVPLDVGLGFSSAENEASRRLIEVTKAMSRLPESAPGLDETASEAIRLERRQDVDEIYAAQDAALDRADDYGQTQERAMFALGLVAIGASLLGIAGLIGESRAGRATLVTAAATLLVALGAGVSGLV